MRKSFHVLSVGNCVERKGFLDLACAVHMARYTLPISWCHIGTGPELEEMKRLVPSMEHYDWVPRIPWESAECVVVPSKTDKRGLQEGLGLVAIEAILHQVWLISTLNGGLVDVTLNGQFCDMVPEGDPTAIFLRFEQGCPSYSKRMAYQAVSYAYSPALIRHRLNRMIQEGINGATAVRD